MNKDPLGKYEQNKGGVAILVPDITVFKSKKKKKLGLERVTTE